MPTPTLRSLTILAPLGAALLLFACNEAKKTETAAQPMKAAEPPKPAPPAAPPPASSSDPECVGAFSESGTLTKLDIGGKSFEVMGAALSQGTRDDNDEAVLGVLANIKEDTPENLKNLRAVLDFFKAEKAEYIVVDGDLGETEAQIGAVLEPIAQAGLPTFVLIGNREGKSKFNNAVKAAQAKYSNVVNMNHVRLAKLDDVSLVSLPGYHDKSYIHDPAGCAYAAQDVEGLKPIIKAATEGAVVLVSHGGPKQDGPEALDRTLEQVNVGDPNLARLLGETGVKLGIFANVQEAGGRATNLAGNSLVAEGKMAPELYLNPGAVDSVRWSMNDRTESVGMAAVLKIKGKEAAFKVHRLGASEKK